MKMKFIFSSLVAATVILLSACSEDCTTCTKQGEPMVHKICGNKYEICFDGGMCVDTTGDQAFIDATLQGLNLMGYTCQ